MIYSVKIAQGSEVGVSSPVPFMSPSLLNASGSLSLSFCMYQLLDLCSRIEGPPSFNEVIL